MKEFNISAKLREEVEGLGLAFSAEETNGDIRVFELSMSTPAGQDATIRVDINRNACTSQVAADGEFADSVMKEGAYYDVSAEAYKWLDENGHGKDGAPYEMIDVYRDFETVRDKIKELGAKVRHYWHEARAEKEGK